MMSKNTVSLYAVRQNLSLVHGIWFRGRDIARLFADHSIICIPAYTINNGSAVMPREVGEVSRYFLYPCLSAISCCWARDTPVLQ